VAVRGIEARPALIVADLQTAPLVAGDAVADAIGPVDEDREVLLVEPWVAGRRAEEELLLARGSDATAEHVGEEVAQPWPAREHVLIRGQGGVARAQVLERAGAHRSWRHVREAVRAPE